MAKTRRKSLRTSVKGRKSNPMIVKKSPVISQKRATRDRIQKNRNKNSDVFVYESPLKHLRNNGEQSNVGQPNDTNRSEDLSEHSENEQKIHPTLKEQCRNKISSNQEEINSSTSTSETQSDLINLSTFEESDQIFNPVKKRKLNKSALSRIRENNQSIPTKLLENIDIDESVICVDDLDTSSTKNATIKPHANCEDVVVIDSNQSLIDTSPCIEAGPNENVVTNFMDSVIVLDDEPQMSVNDIPTRPTEDCMVVWSSLPTTSSKQSIDSEILKCDKILLDTSGEPSNLKFLQNNNNNRKLGKKSPKVTKFGVKKLPTKKLSEVTKGLSKTKIITKTKLKVTKPLAKKKNNGELIFSAQNSESKDKQTKTDSKTKKGTLREIVIDGSNVAMAYTHNKLFSEKGIKMLIDYFSKRGHTVKVFVPQYRRAKHNLLLEKWYKEGIVVFTPSRKLGNKFITSYDDRYILEYATACKGIVVSQDQFRDLYAEKDEYRDTIEKRLLIPTFVGDYVMFPEDPLGRDGPSLAEFLKH